METGAREDARQRPQPARGAAPVDAGADRVFRVASGRRVPRPLWAAGVVVGVGTVGLVGSALLAGGILGAARLGVGSPGLGLVDRVGLMVAGVTALMGGALLAASPLRRWVAARPVARLGRGGALWLILCLLAPPLNRFLLPEGPPHPDVILWQIVLPALAAGLTACFAFGPVPLRLAVGAFVFGIALVEGGFRLAESLAPAPTVGQPSIVTEDTLRVVDDPRLGYRLAPDQHARRRRTRGTEVIYDASYTIGPTGWRVTPQAPTAPAAPFIAVLGDSLVFGTGLQDDQTLPAQLARHATGYAVYNFGVPGYGPQQSLVMVSHPELGLPPPGRRGTALVVLTGDHLARLVGTLPVHVGWADQHPMFVLDGTGKLVHVGTLTTGRPLAAALFSLLARSRIVQQRGWPFPDPTSRAALALGTRVLEETCTRFARRYVAQGCKVVVYPEARGVAGLVPRLRAAGVDVLDYVDLFRGRDLGPYFIAGDGHPSARADALVAQRLARDLGVGRE